MFRRVIGKLVGPRIGTVAIYVVIVLVRDAVAVEVPGRNRLVPVVDAVVVLVEVQAVFDAVLICVDAPQPWSSTAMPARLFPVTASTSAR